MKRFNFKGDIISDSAKWLYNWLEMPSVSHGDIINFLSEADGDDVEIYIDSPGGLVNVGSAIYGELRNYAGKSTAYILGNAGSSASVAMLGADSVVAIPTAAIIIHNTQARAAGDYRIMEEAYAQLKEANESVINAYEIKTGMSRKDLQNLMDKTTRMSAQTALEYGFIDEIALKDGESISAIENAISESGIGMFAGGITMNAYKAQEMADKIKNLFDNNADPPPEPELEPLKNDNGGESQPVSDEQRRYLHDLRKKINS